MLIEREQLRWDMEVAPPLKLPVNTAYIILIKLPFLEIMHFGANSLVLHSRIFPCFHEVYFINVPDCSGVLRQS